MAVVGETVGARVERQHVLGRWLYSPSRGARVSRWAVAALTVGFGVTCMRLPVDSLQAEYSYRKDFLQEYTLVRAIAERSDPYLPTVVLAERFRVPLPGPVFAHPTPHPPPVGVLLLPLALLDYSTASVLWLAVELLCLVASVHLLGRAVGAPLKTWQTLAISAALIAWYPFWFELLLGQLMLPMLALLAAAWLALREGRSTLAGALVGLTILIKPVMVPLLLLFAFRKDTRALAGAILVTLSGYLAAGLIVGMGRLGYYFTTVLPLVASGYRGHAGNTSLWSVGWRLFDGTGSAILHGIEAPPLVRSELAARLVSAGVPALALLLSCAAVRKDRSPDVSWALLIGVSILTSPISWGNYLVLAALPAAWVIRWLLARCLPSRETNLSLLVALLLIPGWNVLGRLACLLGGSSCATAEAVLLPFAPALVTFLPAVAVGALTWLVAFLGRRDETAPSATVASPRPGQGAEPYA